MVEKKRFDGLDIIKAFAILAVLALHVPLWWNVDIIQGGLSKCFQYTFRLISEGVPFFVTINGFLLFRKDTFDLKSHIKKMCKMFMVLIVWGILLTVIGFTLLYPEQELTFVKVCFYIANTRIGAEFTGVLWFVQYLLAVYLVFPMLWYVYKEHFDIFKYIFCVVSFLVLGIDTLAQIRDFISALSGNELLLFSDIIGFLKNFSFISYGWILFYFCMGGMIFHYIQKIIDHKLLLGLIGVMSWPIAVIFGFIVSKYNGEVYNLSFNYGSVFMVAFVIGVFAIMIEYENKGNLILKFISSIGKNTFGIYLSHFIFIYIVNNYWLIDSSAKALKSYIFVFICSYLFTLIVKRIPILRQLVIL